MFDLFILFMLPCFQRNSFFGENKYLNWTDYLANYFSSTTTTWKAFVQEKTLIPTGSKPVLVYLILIPDLTEEGRKEMDAAQNVHLWKQVMILLYFGSYYVNKVLIGQLWETRLLLLQFFGVDYHCWYLTLCQTSALTLSYCMVCFQKTIKVAIKNSWV